MTEATVPAAVSPIPPISQAPIDPTGSIPPAPPNSPNSSIIVPRKRKRNHSPLEQIDIPNAEVNINKPTQASDIPKEEESEDLSEHTIPQYEIDFNESEALSFTETYWLGLTADAPFQYVSIPGAMLYKFVEPIEGKNSKGEPNSVPKRGQEMKLTETDRKKLVTAILNRGIYFTGRDFKSGRDFKLPVDYKSYNKWSQFIHPMGWYVYFMALKDLENIRAGDHRSIGSKAYRPHTLVKRPATMGHGFECSVMPDLKLEKDTEFFTLKLPKGRF